MNSTELKIKLETAEELGYRGFPMFYELEDGRMVCVFGRITQLPDTGEVILVFDEVVDK